ncbi:MAG: hypothetical protein KC621_18345, partial [Myxococcales bacterium]|nr:hypothetical protein [Myxococcales bacterium]
MLLVTTLACTAPTSDPPPDGPEARFDLRPSAALFDAPFPSLHRQEAGGLRADDWPNPSNVPWVASLVDASREVDGAGTTSGVMFSFREPVTLREVDPASSLLPDAPAFLVALDDGERVPIDLYQDPTGGPYGAANLVTLLPLQGVPLRPHTLYAAVLRTDLGLDAPLGVPEDLQRLRRHERPAGVSSDVAAAYSAALELIGDDVPVAALAVFATADPTADFLDFVEDARARPAPTPLSPLTWLETHDAFCVYETTVEMPSYQSGEPPFLTEGGTWRRDEQGHPVVQRTELARLFVTLPRSPMPAGGWPVAFMVRTGGGGDLPLI